MWRLVKADIQYYWYIFIIPCILVCILLGFVGFVKGWPEPGVDLVGTRSLLMTMAAVVFFYRVLRSMLEKRDRYQMLLPLSGTRAALSRLMFMICLWTCFVLLYWLSTLTVKPYSVEIIIWEMLSVTGFVLMANALPYIHHDLVLCLLRSYQKTLWMISYVSLVCSGIVLFLSLVVTESSWKLFRFFLPLKNSISPFTASVWGASILMAIGLSLTWMSVLVFKRRQTYTD
jgi:hypothetical protein